MAGNARKEKFETFRTPPGTLAGMVVLNTPREYQDDGKPKYFTDFLLDGEAAAAFEKQIGGFIDAATQKFDVDQVFGVPHSKHVDYDTKEPTGFTAFRFSVAATLNTKRGDVWDRKPVFVDSKGELLRGEYPNLGAGSRVAIAFQVYAWKQSRGVGVTLQPTHIQLLEVVEYAGAGGNGGFEDTGVAGGFVADNSAPAADTARAAPETGGFREEAPAVTGGRDF